MTDSSMPSPTRNKLFCFGYGFSAEALGRRLLAQGWTVAGTSRSDAGRAALAAKGVEAYRFDRTVPLDPSVLAGTTHLLISVPPDDRGDPVLDVYADDIARLACQWIGYLSTTGVYGDHGGGWVDESTPLTPLGERGHRRVEAELAWFALGKASGQPTMTFRLAGIYGPGRSALDTVRSGRAHRIVKPGQVFSRIHVEDIASVLEASIARPVAGAAYNVCDDEAAPPQDVIEYACQLLNVAPPPETPFDQAVLSPMAASFYAESKRVRNDLIKSELGVTLAYPTYRDGLTALLKAE